ncbi:MAG: FKBP-type peptidyl-prolyl cis-trans isomerase [Saprospiraceae bacterium]|nr:FKBP-type peptidyl-prolyl cis-trans isomerase [Saprospiraceae bacterium]MDW8230877.1 FKBP-type peptidyl-prolyl cis-trans isomerase [Saprospiraceae bacterium]
MNKILLFALALTTAVSLNAQRATLKTAQDSASFAYGMLIGNSLKRQLPIGLNMDLVMRGLSDAIKDAEMPMDQQTATDVFNRYTQEAQRRAAEEGKAAGQKFLEENKKRSGVITTASGLQYEVLKRGNGKESPKATDRVKVHYHGTNIDGSVFDSSVERGQPITFGLNQVIAGWTEGLQLMRVGDKFKFYIPSELAYGERSPSPKIKPNSVLIFEVELFEINPKE